MDKTQIEAGYLKLLDQKRKYLKELYPLDSKCGWHEDACDKGVTIHAHIDPETGLKIIRANTRINAPPAKVIEVGENPNNLLEWDGTLSDIKMIHKTKEYYIFYALVEKLPLVKQRESILLAKLYYEDDGTIEGVSCSIDNHPDVPKSADRIRATSYLVGIVAKPYLDDHNVTDYTYILHVNPEGLIPTTVFNWFVNGQGFSLRPFADFVEKEWKKDLEAKNKKEMKKNEEKEVKKIGKKEDVKEMNEKRNLNLGRMRLN